MSTLAAILFWLCAVLILYTHLGYPLALRGAARRPPPPDASPPRAWEELPRVSLIVPAYDEEEVIARQGRQRARARLPARAPADDRRLRRLRRRHRRARPRGRRRPRPRAAAAAARSPP